MTFSDLIREIQRAAPLVGFHVNAIVRKTRMNLGDEPEVFFQAELYLPDKTVHAEAPTPLGIWERYRDLVGKPSKNALQSIDPHRLARGERAKRTGT